MSLSVHSSQSELSIGGVIHPVPLVRLTTYTNRAAETVDQEFWFSDRSVIYDYGNSGTDRSFLPVLSGRWSDLFRETINHIPDPRSAQGFTKEFVLRLSNVQTDGGNTFLSELLRATNLDLARVEVSEILLGPDRDSNDLTDLVGDEYVVRFRGDLYRYFIGDLIDLRFRSTIPPMPWVYADDPTINDPLDVGKRLPIIMGRPKRVELIGWQVGWVTTFAEFIDPDRTGRVAVTDVTGFPTTGTFQVVAGDEEMTMDGVQTSDNTVNIVARATAETVATKHLQGDAIVELPLESIYIASSRESASIDALYIRNPLNNELFASLPNYTVSLSDKSLIPGESVTSVRFTRDELRALIVDAFVATRVTIQPEFSGGTSLNTLGPYLPSEGLALPYLGGYTDGRRRVTASSVTGNTRLTRDTAGTTSSVRRRYNESQGLPGNTPVSIEVVFKVNFSNSTGNTYTANFSLNHITPIRNFKRMRISSNATATGLVQKLKVGRDNPISQLGTNDAEMFFYLQAEPSIAQGDYVELASGWGIVFEEINTQDTNRVQDVDIQAASVGFGLRLYADMAGAVIPAPDFSDIYDFDDETNWNVDDCVHAEETIGGRTGQKFTRSAATIRYDCDTDATNWTNHTGAVYDGSVADANIGGFDCIGLTLNDGTKRAAMHRVFPGAEDWITDVTVAFDVWIDEVESLQEGFIFYFNTSAVPTTWNEFAGYQINAATLGLTSGAWQTVILDLSSTIPSFNKDLNDFTALTSLSILANLNQLNTTSNRQYYFKDFRVFPKTFASQKNDLATLDWDSADDEYTIAVRATKVAPFNQITVYWSNTAGSGTTPPADRFEVVIPKAELSDGAWVTTSVQQATAVGTPGTVDSVQTFGIIADAVTGYLIETDPEISGQPTVYVDQLRGRVLAESSAYEAGVGEVVEQVPDVVRYILTEILGMADSELGASWAAAVTALGTNLVAGDLRWFGRTVPEILQRIAFEHRVSITTEETQAATVWHLHAATHDTGPDDFTWPAASGSITQWQRFAEEGRDAGTLSSRFIFFYNFNASLGSSDEQAFTKVARANPDSTDLVVPTTAELQSIEDIYGRQDAEPFFFRATNDDDTAKEVAAYLAHEAIRIATVYVISGVPWSETFQLQRNDIVNVTPPWKTSAQKVRVLEVERDLTSGLANVRAVEVD